jgi:hypothetical protein
VLIQSSSEALAPRGNIIDVATYNCGGSSTVIGGLYNKLKVISRYDGIAGDVGANFAVVITGKYNQVDVSLEDESPSKVRGVEIMAGAEYNKITSYVRNTTVQDFANNDISNTNQFAAVYETGLSDIPQEVTLANGWSYDYGFTVKYVKNRDNFVSLSGIVSNGSGVITTLPVGFRPANNLLIPTVIEENVGIVQIATNGDITVVKGSNTRVNLNPVRFLAN